MSNDIKILKEVKQKYRLEFFCPDCEEQKAWNEKHLDYEDLNSDKWFDEATGWCFNHRWDNPIRLKEEKPWKLLTLFYILGSLVVGHLVIPVALWSATKLFQESWLVATTLISILVFLWIALTWMTFLGGKMVIKDWKEYKSKLSEWKKKK